MVQLGIVSYSESTVNTYAEQIESLFTTNISIKKYKLCDIEEDTRINVDILLVTTLDIYTHLKNNIVSNNYELIVAKRTISKKSLGVIKSIDDGERVYVLDENLAMAKSIISVIYEIGVRHVELVPIDMALVEGLSGELIISLRQGPIKLESNRVIELESSILDINTILDIAIKSNLDHITNNKNIVKDYKEFTTANFGFSKILGKTNKIESQLEILLQVIDDAIIAVDKYGRTFSFNESAERLFEVKKDSVIGKDGFTMFPNIPFNRVLRGHSFKERIVEIDGYTVIMSITRIEHSNNTYGAIATLKRFNDLESKQHRIRKQIVGKGHRARYCFDDIIGESQVIKKTIDIAKRMSNSNSSILITGESGSGKELFAQAIHNNSSRSKYQFVAVNCGALPENLLESELFGYVEGAFTGAKKGGKPGLLELAHKGTLFLDEIGEMPLNLQMRLLRVLQERQVRRVGGDNLINIDVRIIAATNKDIRSMVEAGNFRRDLYFRLNVLPLKIPPLRDRTEDILPIVERLKERYNHTFNFTDGAKSLLVSHKWIGNVRELSNYIEYIVNLNILDVGASDIPLENFDCMYSDVPTTQSSEIDVVINEAGRSVAKYIFVLNTLHDSFNKRQRLGRRSIADMAKQEGIFLSEQEIRKILMNLQNRSMVEILKGRGGTVITQKGIEALSIMRSKIRKH